MKMQTNPNVETFLKNLHLVDSEKHEIISALRNLVFTLHPSTTEKIMYGGIVFFHGKEMYGGVFAAKNHVTFEFSVGFKMNDPNHFLEGTGKYRRHLKFYSLNDLASKKVDYYLKQANH